MPAKKKVAAPPKVANTAKTRAQAIAELGINVPYYTCRVVGGRLEFSLYGGDVVYWPPPDEEG